MATSTSGIADRAAAIVGAEHVVTDAERRRYFSTDLSFEPTETASLVVAPGSPEELAALVRVAHEAGLPVVPRGGGMSYTKGYTPAHEQSVLVDMRRCNRIEEINLTDGYVTVQGGVTWEELYEALRAQGVRTPYYGPLSGRYATVGGALSQNSVFWGAARHGTLAESVLSMEVVTGSGRVVRTGTAGRRGSTPFFRWFGPDMTGVFVGDTGALGIKARATLRIFPFPAHTAHHSLAVADFAAAIDCMQAVGRFGIATEVYNLDPFYADTMVKAGLTVLADHPWSVHFTVDGASEAIVAAGIEVLADAAAPFGEPIDPIVPAVFRDDPFGAVQSVLLGPEGQIWLPIHAVLPYSRAQESARAVKAFEEENRAALDAHGIKISYLTLSSQNDFLFEPAFYWFDELGEFRLERISEEAAGTWSSIPADQDARSVVLDLRRRLARVFDELGAVHIQIGKYYEYQSMLEPELLGLVRAIKTELDPDGLVNPGSLGF